jgi:AraC-like DNA-binding protein
MPHERTFLSTRDDALLLAPAAEPSAYECVRPSPALAPFVERIDLGRETVPWDAGVEERVLPDGAAHLIFNFGDVPAVVGRADAPLHAVQAIGPTRSATVIRMAGRVEAIGVRLRPGGVAALLGAPAGELTDRGVPLGALWGSDAHEAHERLAAAPHGAARAAVLEELLLRRLRGTRDDSGIAAAAVRRIDACGGAVTVRTLADEMGVGERRLEQLFHRHVGLTPKAACRLARFHASVRAMRRDPARRWSEIAHLCGYADHAHLVHDFRAFAGLAPTELRARLDLLPDFGFPQAATAAPR